MKIFIYLTILFLSLYGHDAIGIGNCQARRLVFTHVNVVDTSKGVINSNMTVVIDGKTISRIDKTDEFYIPKNCELINASNKFLIPGLWDMHTHWYETDYLPLFIANGVTGIRLMHGVKRHFDWRKDVESGKLVGPRMMIASRIFDGPNPLWGGSVVLTNPQQTPEAVRKAKNTGCDFIKVYSKLSRNAYYSIADQCHKQAIAFAGHVPYTISILEASAAGQKSIEHMVDLIRGFSNQEDILQAEFQKKPQCRDQIIEKALDSFDPDQAHRIVNTLINNNTWLCPTLNLHRHYYLCYDKNIYTDSRLEYIPRFLREEWKSKHDLRLKLYTEEYRSSAEKIFAGYRNMVNFLNKNGYGDMILAGTDTGNPYCMPGFSLHDELQLLVTAGMTPSQALRASTYNAARFLNREDSMGTIDEGKLADLVLLESNPLDDIHNTTKIAAIVFDGRLFKKEDIQQMIASLKAMKSN